MRVENSINVVAMGRASADWAPKAAPAEVRSSGSRGADPQDSIVLARAQDLSSVQFAIDMDASTKEIVVKMVDQTTGEVVRQIPSEAILRMARAINEMMATRESAGEQGQ